MSHENWHNKEYMTAKRSEVAKVARELRDGCISVVEGAWRLSALQREVTRADFDDDFMLFVAIASETDHLPVGEVRRRYSKAALQKADSEIKKVEEFYRAKVAEACEKLLVRFGNVT